MNSIVIIPFGDGQLPDLAPPRKVHHLGEGAPPIRIAGLAAGMTSGAPSVAIVIDLPDGSAVFAETSLKLLCGAADALRATYSSLAMKPPKDAS